MGEVRSRQGGQALDVSVYKPDVDRKFRQKHHGTPLEPVRHTEIVHGESRENSVSNVSNNRPVRSGEADRGQASRMMGRARKKEAMDEQSLWDGNEVGLAKLCFQKCPPVHA